MQRLLSSAGQNTEASGLDNPLKIRPPYAIASVDHALRAATMLQLEGGLSVSEVADRLGVARSTAHRLLAMLVYRDFAAQDENRVYHAGPLLELAAHSQSAASAWRAAALPHLRRLVELLGETTNLTMRTGDTARFIASVESQQGLRVSSREGMVFPAHRTTAGLLLLAGLSKKELEDVYAEERYYGRLGDRPDLTLLRSELARVRRNGFAINNERSERGLVAIGVAVRGPGGAAQAGISVSMPTVRYDSKQLQPIVATLSAAGRALEVDLVRLIAPAGQSE